MGNKETPPLRRLSKELWTDHEQFEWGTERFVGLQLNAMSGRLAGQYYVTLESVPISERAAAAGTVADTIALENGENNGRSPLLHGWQDEYGKALVQVGNTTTRRRYR